MSSDNTSPEPRNGLRAKAEELTRREVETAAAPILNALSDLNMNLLQTTREMQTINADLKSNLRQIRSSETRRPLALLLAALMIAILAGTMSAYMMKNPHGGSPEWSNRLR